WALGRDPEARARREFGFAAAVLVGGLAIGAPQILANARTSADPKYQPAMERMARGQHLPLGHPARLRYLKNTWALAKVAFGAAAVLALALGSGAGKKDCHYEVQGEGLDAPGESRAAAARLATVWAALVAAYLLCNSAAVTGREFENFHWVYVQN